MHAATRLHLAAVGPKGTGLHAEQDHWRAAALRNVVEIESIVVNRQSTRPDQQTNPVAVSFPWLIIEQTMVRKGGQGEARIANAGPLAFLSQDRGGDNDQRALLRIGSECFCLLAAALIDQPMQLAHGVLVSPFVRGRLRFR